MIVIYPLLGFLKKKLFMYFLFSLINDILLTNYFKLLIDKSSNNSPINNSAIIQMNDQK